MEKYINILDKYKVHLTIFMTLIVALMSIALKDIAFEGSYRIWFDKDSHIIKNYDGFRSRFGNDDSFIIAFKDENGIFTQKALETILSLTSELEKISDVQRVDSLSNYQYIYSEDESLIVEDFLNPSSNLDEKKQIALKDNLILNSFISQDGKTTLVRIKLANNTTDTINIKVMDQLQQILTLYEQKSGYKFYISGAPAITASLVEVSQHDAMILMPLAVISVVVLLLIFFRSKIGILVPSVVIVFTFLPTLAMQTILGYNLNNFTVNIPAFVTAIAIADSMHLYIAWVYYKQKGYLTKEALTLALKSNLIPIALTSITTATGFATLGLSPIVPIATLGIAITSAALLALLLSITLAPAIILMLKPDYNTKPIRFLSLLKTHGYGAFIQRNDKKIVLLFMIIFLFIGYGLNYVKIDSNSIKYFSQDTVVRSGNDFVQENLTGSMVYEVIVDSKKQEGIKDPKYLHSLVRFENDLKKNFPNVTYTTSLKDIIVRMNQVLDPNATKEIPDNKELIAQYILLYSMSLPQGMEINDKIDTNERYLRLSINSNIQDTSKDLMMIRWIENWWKDNTTYSAEVQGQTSIFAYMQKNVTDTLIVSVLSTLAIVSAVMLFIFKKLKLLLLFIVPNIAPIILVGGVMGYLGIDIDIGVAISAAVILGIAVDDTIHFFSKYFESMRLRNFEESIDYVINHSGIAMILTTFILSVTFSLFGLSSFIPNVNFAIVTVVALNIALVFDLVLLPALLSLFFKNQK